MRFKVGQIGRIAAILFGGAIAVASATSAARADVVGTLQCNIAPGMGAIIASSRAVSCTFQSPNAPVQLYNGTVNRLGVDIGPLTSGSLTYQVIALGAPVPGSLQGSYIGSGARVTLGTGIGVDALIGGSGNTITLQPIATTISTGSNISAGLGSLQLAFAGIPQPPMMRHRHRRHHRRMHHRHM